MEVFVILESFTDYKGGNATSWGVYPTRAKAIEAMPKAILDRFNFDSVEDWKKEYDEDFNSHFRNEIADNDYWACDEGDTFTEFYIMKDEFVNE